MLDVNIISFLGFALLILGLSISAFLDLKVNSINKWVTAVMDFEVSHGPFERQTISPEIKETISDRWGDPDIYFDCLPVNCRDETLTRDSWMNPKVVSTRALGEFLIRATKLGQGTAYGGMKYQEFILWINTQSLIFSKEKLRDSYEPLRRLLREKLKVLEPEELSHHDQKACCKAIHTMIVRSEQKGKLERILDDEIFNCFLTALKVDKTDNIMETFSLLNDGYSAAMKQVVTNPMRNMNLFVERPPTLRALPLKEGSTTKPKDSSSPSPAPRSKSKDPSNNNSKKDEEKI
jgi:hypothetical protein